jgi:lysophospholipase L1-like esterase
VKTLAAKIALVIVSAIPMACKPTAVEQSVDAEPAPIDAPITIDAGFKSSSMWFVGDSYLEGAKAYLPSNFVGFSQSVFAKVGDTLLGRAVFLDQAAASDARGVIVQLGINDIASGTNQTVLKQRIAATMDKMHNAACVGWPTYPTKIVGGYSRVAPLAPILNGMIRDAAVSRPWIHVIEFGPMMDADVTTLRSSDGLHPTQAGYKILAKQYAKALVTDCTPR